jgi:hypothetical protein
MTLISVFREMISRTRDDLFEFTLLSNRFHRAPDCCNLIVKFPRVQVTLWRAIFPNEWPPHPRNEGNHVIVLVGQFTKLPICFPKIPPVGGTVDEIATQRTVADIMTNLALNDGP